MKPRYLRIPDAATEYFSGNLDHLVEVALMRELMIFVRLAVKRVRLAPLGNYFKPTKGELDTWPEDPGAWQWSALSGHHPLNYGQSRKFLSDGHVDASVVIVRSSTEIDGKASASFYDLAHDKDRDRYAWFDDYDGVREIHLTMHDGWISRRHLERAIRDHNPVFNQAEHPAAGASGYSTKLLQDLLAAANEFYASYDPKQPEPPKKAVVTHWLINERKVSERIADAMDTILRPAGITPGPRKAKK